MAEKSSRSIRTSFIRAASSRGDMPKCWRSASVSARVSLQRKVADLTPVDCPEVVLPVGIVVFGVGFEGAHLRQQRATLLDRHGFYARGDHHCAADEAAAEIVVEFADTFDCGHDGTGHGSYLS